MCDITGHDYDNVILPHGGGMSLRYASKTSLILLLFMKYYSIARANFCRKKLIRINPAFNSRITLIEWHSGLEADDFIGAVTLVIIKHETFNA